MSRYDDCYAKYVLFICLYDSVTNVHLVQRNALRAVPNEIGSLVRLEELCVDGNKLHALPATLGACVRLIALRARDNA